MRIGGHGLDRSSRSSALRLRRPCGGAQGTPLFHHRRELRGTHLRLSLVGEAHALNGAAFKMRVASVKAAAAHEPQVHTRLAISDERREVAARARRERHSVLDALAHARVGAEDDLTHASHRALGGRPDRLEPAFDVSGAGHAPIVAATSHRDDDHRASVPTFQMARLAAREPRARGRRSGRSRDSRAPRPPAPLTPGGPVAEPWAATRSRRTPRSAAARP